MLQMMNFYNQWVSWIRGCLESNFVSVLINCSPSPKFKMWKGLQQVDLMTPFLFLVAVEGFNGLLKTVMDLNKFTCFRVGREGEVGSLCFTLRMIRTLFYQGSLCAKCCNFEMYSKILQIEVKFEIEFLQVKINLMVVEDVNLRVLLPYWTVESHLSLSLILREWTQSTLSILLGTCLT